MRSPFLQYQNATLTFDQLVGSSGVNAVGNRKLQTDSLTVTAFLKRVVLISASQVQRLPGLNSEADYWTGYAVTPMQLPLDIKQGDRAKAVISGEHGIFIVYGLINAPYGRNGIGAVVERTAGTKFSGWFNRGGVLDGEV